MKKNLALILSLMLLFSPASISLAEETLTVYLPQFTVGNAQEESCDYASRMLRTSGIHVDFRVYVSEDAGVNSYMQFIRDNIHKDNAAFVLNTEPLEFLKEEGWIDEIHPLSHTAQPLNRLAVLIKNDVFSGWGQSIRTASELEAFLAWRREETGKAPCTAASFLYDRMYGGFLWLNLFLPEEGYFPINNEFPALASAADFYSDFSGENLFSFATLPALSDCALRYLQWMENDWLDAYMPMPRTQLAQYEAVIVNTEDFLMPLMLRNNAPLSALDFSGYTLQILYAQDIPRFSSESVPASAYGICSGENAQPLVDNFLAWLEQENNYRLLRYGAEGTDFRVEDEAWVILPESGYSLWEQRVVFENTRLEPPVFRENLPANFREEMQLVSEAPAPLFPAEKLDAAADLLIREEVLPPTYQMSSSAHSFWERIYQYRTAASESAIIQWLDTVIQPPDALDETLDELSMLLLNE